MPRLADPDPPLPAIVTAAEAHAAGLTRDQVRHRVRSGRWVVLAHGVYRREGALDERPVAHERSEADRVDHAHRAIAAALARPGCVVARHSAAMLHGLPLFGGLPDEVALVAPPGRRVGRSSGAVVHRMDFDECDVVRDRVLVTTVARTWFDIARLLPFADGLAVGDAALREGRVTKNDLLEAMSRARARRGVARARRVALHLDAVRESVAESGSWAYFIQHGLPLPRAQVTIHGAGGRFIARVDFWWEGHGLVGECDGRLKYDSREVLYREKRREDELRAEGYRVVRWGWGDLHRQELAARLQRLLA